MLTKLLGGLLLGVSVAAPIGPVNVVAIRRGLAGGFGPAFRFGMEAATADLAYVLPSSFFLLPSSFFLFARALAIGWVPR
ncbi:MAG: hypothetical protein HY784_00895 [Chloroflexi bacterium]|nr:hypothetical protein [Chloroflexota bacterium]